MAIEEQKSPCFSCNSEVSRNICARRCSLLASYREYLEKEDDGIERKSTLGGGSGYKIIFPSGK